MLSPIVEIYRFDEQGGTYESFTLVTFFLGEATVHGMCKSIKPSQARRFINDMRLNGVHTIRYVRKGRIKIHKIKG